MNPIIPTDTVALIVGVFAAIPISVLGVFVVARRLALTGDALSHVALPGVALGLLLHTSPLLGALVFLFLGVLLMRSIMERTHLRAEVIIGVIFSFSLALGIVLMPQSDLEEALFGNITKVTAADLVLTVVVSIVLLLLILRYLKLFALLCFSDDLARARAQTYNIEFILIALIALSIALGIKVTGILFIGSLLIIPAATAESIARSLRQSIALAACFGVLSIASGILVSRAFSMEPGAAIVMAESGYFALTLVVRYLRG